MQIFKKIIKKETEEREQKSIIPENYIKRFKDFVKKNPKQIFIGMIVLTLLSIISNLVYYFYIIKPSKVTYEAVNERIFNRGNSAVSSNSDASILEHTQNYLEMKKDLDRLKDFQKKKVLSKEDSLEISQIVKKYNLR